MLPSKGRCHAVFILIYSARLKRQSTVDAWISSAMSKASFAAQATDIRGIAFSLLEAGLAVASDSGIEISLPLKGLDEVADHETLVGIAYALLRDGDIPWLSSAFVDGNFTWTLVPEPDRLALQWLEPELDDLLASIVISRAQAIDDGTRKALGDAGEQVLLAALRDKGMRPVHVAAISDNFGYDVENRHGGLRERIEVKTSVPASCGRIFISRNEYDKASAFGKEWFLIQVILSSVCIRQGKVFAADILSVRKLAGAQILAMGPPDSANFRWAESAEFMPDSDAWLDIDLRPSPSFEWIMTPIPEFKDLNL